MLLSSFNIEETMKVAQLNFTFVWILFLAILKVRQMSGAVILTPFNPVSYNGPLGREFGFMNLIPVGSQVTPTEFNALVTKEAALEANFAILQAQMNSLVTSVSPKCPASAASGSLVVGLYCYSVTSTPATFSAAQSACNAQGGILAEPLFPNSQTFYTSIAAKFPTQTAAIRPTGEIWIGLQELPSTTATPNPFTYVSNGMQVPATSPPFASVPAAPTVPSTSTFAATLVSPGTGSWKFYDTSLPTSTRAYICQFRTVL